MLAVGAVLLAESGDRRIRTPAELEEFTGLPLLSAIPSDGFSPNSAAQPKSAEAFHMLRGALTYFNVDRRLSSVVITSAGQQDGKTTVAVQLALAVARAGKRVILVDADLRHPQVSSRIGIEESVAGLGALLVGDSALSHVLVEYPMEDELGGGRLLILPAGLPPPNPSELLSSRNLRDLLASLEQQSDLVIVDSAAALAVSDALPLLAAASGVVLVARMDQSTRDAVRRLQRIVVKSSGELLGVVATGTSAGSGYSGYATDVYAAAPNIAGGRLLARLRRDRSRRRAQRAQRRAVSRP
jgi:capsular exopolysaccharide synthesis family protein